MKKGLDLSYRFPLLKRDQNRQFYSNPKAPSIKFLGGNFLSVHSFFEKMERFYAILHSGLRTYAYNVDLLWNKAKAMAKVSLFAT